MCKRKQALDKKCGQSSSDCEWQSFIFYGPHIGITLDGDLGKMYRPRQEATGNSCGALMLALDRFQDSDYKPVLSDDDYQQMKLEESLLPHREDILASKNPQKAITEATYEIIHKKVYDHLKSCKDEFHVDRVTLLGGIIINTDYGLDDYFDARNFGIVSHFRINEQLPIGHFNDLFDAIVPVVANLLEVEQIDTFCIQNMLRITKL